MADRRMTRSTLLAAALIASLMAVVLTAPVASAAPKGNDNWIILEATCGGEEVLLLDPRGGNTAFLVGGTVGVGKRFRFSNLDSGEVLAETANGAGVAEDRLTYCTIILPDIPIDGGTVDILFEVWVLVTPQGR